MTYDDGAIVFAPTRKSLVRIPQPFGLHPIEIFGQQGAFGSILARSECLGVRHVGLKADPLTQTTLLRRQRG